MTCSDSLPTSRSFTELGIDYFICNTCGHLNGGHIDTDEFCRVIYVKDDGSAYAEDYRPIDQAAYQSRLWDIYIPKAEFLRDALSSDGVSIDKLRAVDIGAGSGYMIAA